MKKRVFLPKKTGERQINNFFAKYGKTSAFTLMVIVCLSFLVHLLSVSSGYLQGIDEQALDRAENYAGEQAVAIQEQFGALKMRADYFASEAKQASSLEDAAQRLSSAGISMTMTKLHILFKKNFRFMPLIALHRPCWICGTPTG